MRRINYKSDIPPLLLSLKVDENQITVPDCDFIVRFYIEGYEGRHYDCSHIGGVWSNCEPSEDGTKLVCYINNQRLGIGELCAEFHYISPDRRYSDGSQKSVVIIDSTELGVELVEDNGDAVTEAAIDVTLPFIYRTAYEIARDHGYTGTAEDFYSALASVVGIADAEKKRVTAEITRNANEQERIENEENRLNAENERVSAEAQRVRYEAIRRDAESDRVEQEEDRKAKFKEITEFIATVRANEGNRESNERERQANEDTRITEETKRVEAEKKRAAEFEQQKLDLAGKIDRSGDEMGGDLIFTDNAGVSFRTSDGGAHTMFNDTDDVAKFTADNGDTFDFKQNETPNKNSSAVVVSANLYNALDMTLDSMGSALDGDAAYRSEAGDKIFNPDTCKIQRYNSTIGGFEDLCDPIDGKLYANKMTGYIYRWDTKTKKMVFVGGVKAYTKDEADSRFAKLDDATQIVKAKELEAYNSINTKSMWIGDEGLLLGGDGNGHLTVEQDEVITDVTLNGKLATKVDKTDITQSTGTSETAVMSQKAVSAKLSELESNDERQNREINGLRDQVENYKPIVIEGNVTNAADEEDLTSENGLLKIKNRSSLDGMGYVILRKGKTFAEQVTKENTIYEIRYDFNLNGAEITVPESCVLKFNGGSLNNGTINNGIIDYSGNNKIFTNINFNKLYSLQDVRPEWFGAKGDGIADDTEAIRISFFVCNYKDVNDDRVGCRLFCNPKKYYKISGNINHYNGKDYTLSLNCVGSVPLSTTSYDHINNVTFMLTEGTSMFQNADIYGSLSNCKIVTQNYKADNTYIFNNCECHNLNFSYNTIDRVESFLYNTGIHSLTKIHDNRIVSEYFAKVDKTNSGLVDSLIYNNYITGDVGRTDNIDNYCFGWYVYNGSIIRSNFIDYFNCIYSPQLQDSSQTVLSIGNQYQVFRYFYTSGWYYKDLELKIHTYGISINSIGDSFNWIDPESLSFLKSLKPYYISAKQLQISSISMVTKIKEIPPCIVGGGGYSICIRNAQIEGNIKEFIDVGVPVSSTKNYRLTVDYTRKPSFSNENDFYIEKSDSYYPYYNDIDYSRDYYISGYNILDTLPEIKNFGLWCNYPLGYKVKVGQDIYRLILKRFTNKNVIKFEWEPINPLIIEDKSFGNYQSKPTNVEIGSSYFCTDRQTSEGASNGIMIYYKGNNVWVDALGRVVV